MQFGDFYFIVPEEDITSLPLDKDDRILEQIYTERTGNLGVTQGNSYGSVSVTKGSKNVTGSGTEWPSYIGKGDYFKLYIEPLSYLREIASVSSNTALALLDNYAGETKTNQQYEIYREHMIIGVEEDTFSHILRKYWCREIR
jgi:hypothetical protein